MLTTSIVANVSGQLNPDYILHISRADLVVLMRALKDNSPSKDVPLNYHLDLLTSLNELLAMKKPQ